MVLLKSGNYTNHQGNKQVIHRCFWLVCIILLPTPFELRSFFVCFSAVIMFIVRTDEVNVYVQRILEYYIKNK